LAAISIDVIDRWRFSAKSAHAPVKIAEYHDIYDAAMIRGHLTAQGIESCLQGYHHRLLLYFFGPYIDISLLVAAPDKDRANQLIEEYYGGLGLVDTPGIDDGICIDPQAPHWELDGPKSFDVLFDALSGWLPDDAILYLEDGSPDEKISAFFDQHAVCVTTRVAAGTLWPPPKTVYLPATDTVLAGLAELASDHAEPELAIHFHVYRNDTVLIQWHDAFGQPMLLSGSFSESEVIALARKLDRDYRKIEPG
jgi:hypothetical protein